MKFLDRIRKWWGSLTRPERRLVTGAACLAVVIAAVAIYAIICRSDEPPLPGEPPPAAAAVLLDVSDPVTGRNAAAMIDEIARIGDGLPSYGKLTVYDMHDLYDRHAQSKEVLSLTRPRRESDCCALAERCSHLEPIYMRDFEGALRARLEDFLSAQKCKPISPIIEALRNFSQLSDYRSVPDGSKSLYVVSDMLQHTDEYSHYCRQSEHGCQRRVDLFVPNRPTKCTIKPDEFDKLQNTSYYQEHEADFCGWDVTVLYIRRHGNCNPQGDNHKRFWMDYFKASSSCPLSVKITEVNYFGSGAQCPSRP